MGPGSQRCTALWDSIFSVGMCLALLTFFRHRLNRQSRFGSFLSQQAFTVYIIHIPVIVLLALAWRGIHLEAFLLSQYTGASKEPQAFLLASVGWISSLLLGMQERSA